MIMVEGRRDRAKVRISKLNEKELFYLALGGFAAYWLFLILSWPPLASFLARILRTVMGGV